MEKIQMGKICPLRVIAEAVFFASGKSARFEQEECIEKFCAWFDPKNNCCGVKIPPDKTVDAKHYAK